MTSTFPSTGTWLSRWSSLYTAVPEALPTTQQDEQAALPRISQFTTAA